MDLEVNIKEGERRRFSIDGEITIEVCEGIAVVRPLTTCFTIVENEGEAEFKHPMEREMTNRERALFSAKQMLKPNSPYLEEHRNVAQELLNAQAQIESWSRIRDGYAKAFDKMGKDLKEVVALLDEERELLRKFQK